MNSKLNPNLKTIVFYDASCLMCSRFIQYVANKTINSDLFFSDLHSEVAQNFGIQDKDTIILMHENKFYKKSTAIFVLLELIGISKYLIAPFKLFPLRFRDFVYEWVAKHRKQFQNQKTCPYNPYLIQRILK